MAGGKRRRQHRAARMTVEDFGAVDQRQKDD